MAFLLGAAFSMAVFFFGAAFLFAAGLVADFRAALFEAAVARCGFAVFAGFFPLVRDADIFAGDLADFFMAVFMLRCFDNMYEGYATRA